MRILVNGAAAFCRGWSHHYTAGLPATERDRRLREIDSDLWESRCDGDRSGIRDSVLALSILQRSILGMPSDLLWRFEQPGPPALWHPFLVVTTVGVIAAMFWVFASLRVGALPEPPSRMKFVSAPPPPPPPPPPPAGSKFP
jgi:hypothetical protein